MSSKLNSDRGSAEQLVERQQARLPPKRRTMSEQASGRLVGRSAGWLAGRQAGRLAGFHKTLIVSAVLGR